MAKAKNAKLSFAVTKDGKSVGHDGADHAEALKALEKIDPEEDDLGGISVNFTSTVGGEQRAFARNVVADPDHPEVLAGAVEDAKAWLREVGELGPAEEKPKAKKAAAKKK
jgi:hypothetical protein